MIFPVIEKNLLRERWIRVWTPGETNSVAITLLEFLEAVGCRQPASGEFISPIRFKLNLKFFS